MSQLWNLVIDHVLFTNNRWGTFRLFTLQKPHVRSISQEEILSFKLEDLDRMQGVLDSLQKKPLYRVFKGNSLRMGYYLDSITQG